MNKKGARTVVTAKIDINVRALYLKSLNIEARINQTHSDPEVHHVYALRALNRDEIVEAEEDHKDWEDEQEGKDFRRKPYQYRDSDTAAAREKRMRKRRLRWSMSELPAWAKWHIAVFGGEYQEILRIETVLFGTAHIASSGFWATG